MANTLKQTGFVLLVLAAAYYFFHFPELPDRVPIHFDGQGNPNGYGSKLAGAGLFLIIGAVMFLFHSIRKKDPMTLNYPVQVTEKNVKKLHELSMELMSVMILWMGVFCVYYSWMVIYAVSNPLPFYDNYVFWGLLVSLFILLLIYIFKMLKHK